VLSLYDVAFETAFAIQASPLTRFDLDAVVGDTGSLNAASDVYPHHQVVAFNPTWSQRLTRTDSLDVLLSGEYDVVNGTKLTADSAEALWVHRDSVVLTTRLGAGAVYLTRIDPSGNTEVRPAARAGVTGAFAHERSLRLEGTLDLVYRPLLYLQTATYRPIGTALAGLELVAPPRWRAAVRASFSTTITAHPYVPGEVETYFLAEAPVVYRANPNLALELGVRSLFSAPHLSEPFVPRDTQIWVYGAVTVLFATTPDPTRVTQ
jgi:hypothetical protein